MTSLHDRFWSKVEVGDCWEWTAYKYQGYGRFAVDRRKIVAAHRVAYMLLVGDIPDTLQIDHLCRNRACVNPDHMELVTVGTNVRRGVSIPAQRGRAKVCPNGHPYSGDNVRVSKRGRECRACDREKHRRNYVPAAGGDE